MSTVTKRTPDTTTTPSRTLDETAHGLPSAPSTTTSGGRTVSRAVAVFVGSALAAVAITVGVVGGSSTTSPDVAAGPDGEQAALERLVQLGQIPAEALEPATGEQAVTERLQARGLVPTGPTVPALSGAARERAITRSLVARGLVPRETLTPTTERTHAQRLIVEGLVPDGS